MARPVKMGLDYFPLDITLFSDRKFRKAKSKYGFMAVGVYLSLLKIAYSDKGYYIDYSDKYKEDILFDIQEDLTGKYQPTIEVISDVIELLVASELFSVDHFKNKIITSKRIQVTYYKSKKKSVCITMINPRIWLLTNEEMLAIKKEEVFSAETGVNSAETKVNLEETGINAEKTTQRKEKELKENKNIGEESTAVDTQTIIDLYNEKCPNLIPCTQLTDKRAIKESKLSIEEFAKLFEKANASAFLQGKNEAGFKASLDWLIKPSNIAKVLSGNYDKTFTKKANSAIIADRHNYSQEELDKLFTDDDFDF